MGRSYSREYRLMEKRIMFLGNTLIKDFMEKDAIKFSKKEVELARSYRLLVHAELEDYFESVAKKLLIKAKKKWSEYKKPNLTTLALFAHSKHIDKGTTSTKVNKIIIDFKSEVIDQNHGIKEKNIEKMFIPLGINKDDIDSAWLSTLDTFGAKRGETAHKSGQVQQPIDLRTEVSNIRFIVDGIRDFEDIVSNILRS
ncbi:HEPN_RiboL-PSP domain-containing protein [Clostridium neonatale]|uniref:HEPN domain-containing protein n=1 Tax=Clostridium neonatale TaxID=137838 RepID=UPI00291BF8F8|nr:HEPN domain-containing protein [Clostridium neonatale]CAI3607650.1 HEPN_RiboL-PSP domain-containing protein [Clostridium neonatale]